MKDIDWETFKKASSRAEKWKQDLMSTSKIYDYVAPELLRLGAPTNPSDTLLPIIYHLIGLLNTEEILAELSALKVPDVYNFLNSVIKNVSPIEVNNQKISIPPTPNLSAEISATEHDLESLQNIRTMPHDMHAVQTRPLAYPHASENTYQSVQADLLRPAIPVPEVNKQSPRWDSETST